MVAGPVVKWASVGLLAAAEVLVMGLWFVSAAVLPQMVAEAAISEMRQAALSSAVQIGFVAGALMFAALGLADRLDPRRVLAASGIGAALSNAALLVVEPGGDAAIAARCVTGFLLAGVYPVGMKIAVGWGLADRGLLVGVLVGALTLGSAAPHLLAWLGGVDWRSAVISASLLASLGATLVMFSALGPHHARAPRLDVRAIGRAWTDRRIRLAYAGYLGHMWELYAMWAWLGIFLAASFEINSGGYDPDLLARYATFAVIGAGGLIGCLAGGLLSDRYGRTTLTMAAMAISGSCALVVGFLFGGPPLLLGIICLIWGITIIADSAQFSASITELSEPELIGTMLTVQTCAGFILTLITIHLMPLLVDTVGWSWAFAPLSIGPFLGVWAMARLRRHPDSVRMAAGQR